MKEKLDALWKKTKCSSKRVLRETSYFLTSTYFLKHLGMLIAAALLLVGTVWLALYLYTDHGESIEVGNYIGRDVATVTREAEDRDFEVVITDSIFVLGKRGGPVQDQSPRPGARVKKNRTIRFITYKHTENATLPRLTGNYDFERYARTAAAKDIKIVKGREKFDNKQAPNTILHLEYNGKQISEDDIEAGYELPRGAELSAVVTKRGENSLDYITMPDLICSTYDDATVIIRGNKLVVGTITGESDLGTAYVSSQRPSAGTRQSRGTPVSLTLVRGLPDGCN